ncbi:GH3 family domain-containing protein [Isoalcanivorax indicus]|uniref:GH3 family domain-containing protein n=1 Tax=Isoalcanivorax indicus TaxID=2202653 RepID=UPI000DB9E834|nr:GH3 auxin-responsive promoter family protein [Isoalcanivorax indicus]
MSVSHRIGHGLLRALVNPAGRRFRAGLQDVEAVQRAALSRLLSRVAGAPRDQVLPPVDADWRWEQFAEALPVTGYQDWQQVIERQRSFGEGALIRSPVARYQPTSGSTSGVKWLPYTDLFLHQLNSAIGAWLYDLYRQYPRMAGGSHYWSVSWLPNDMRRLADAHINDDMKLLSSGRRLLASLTQAAPESISLAGTSEDAQFATLVYLVADSQLSVLSVWSPSFALTLFDRLFDWRDELVEVLRQGQWGRRGDSLRHLPCPRSVRAAAILHEWQGVPDSTLFAALWPKLALISAWDTAASATWAEALKALLPHAAFQGKGLWATEGVVTFPWQGETPLAYQSHVYEFEDLDSGRILPPWALRTGQEVQPLLSTGTGLLRYRMQDRVRVSGHLGSVPCLTFLGRDDGVDMVGEKLSAVFVQQVLDGLPLDEGQRVVTLLAAQDSDGQGRAGYLLLLDSDQPRTPDNTVRLAEALDAALGKQFHYTLARNLGQLAPARVLCRMHMRERYLGLCRDLGMIEGNIKIEPLRLWPGTLPVALRDVMAAAPGEADRCAV